MKKAIFASACVLLALTMLVRISSSASYDPWVDLDDNGLINIFDVVTLANSYQTTGDPTKTVNVTNWPTALPVTIAGYKTEYLTLSDTLPLGQTWSQTINTDGYRQITVGVETQNAAAVKLEWTIGESVEYEFDTFQHTTTFERTLKIYAVSGFQLKIWITNTGPASNECWIDLYLTT